MPCIEMPTPEPEPPQTPVAETGESMDIIDEIMEEIENDDGNDHLIEVTEREIPKEDEVFDEPPKVEPVVNTEFIDPNEKKGKRKYTRKAPMSEKQKEHLAKIRKIAQEKRKAEKERKAKEKEEKEMLKAEERLLKKKKAQEEKESQEKSASQPPPPAQPSVKYYTEEDLNKAVLGAVHTYDTYRKAQKREKKAKQAEEARANQMRRTIQNAITPQNTAQATDPWRGLFT